MAIPYNLIGETFGRLTVISLKGLDKHHSRLWECKCTCGKTSYVRSADLMSGKVVSCGCYSRDMARERATKHLMCDSRLYCIYNNMKTRCYRKNAKHYSNYGGRGITICDEWREDFSNFVKWASASGYSDDLTIERVDVNKGYSPDNCTWIPLNKQAINRTTTHYVTYKGTKMPLSYLAEKVGLARSTIRKHEKEFDYNYEALVDHFKAKEKKTWQKQRRQQERS